MSAAVLTPFLRAPIRVIRDILLSELDLDETQIMFSNQKYEIPTVGLYIVISYLGPATLITRMSELVPDGFGGMTELQSATWLHRIQIDAMAYNTPAGGNDARDRKEEIAMALGSIYAEQLQEQYSMQIARNIAPFTDTSFLEETEMMTRYTTLVNTTSLTRKQKSTNEYYDTFPGAEFFVDDFHPKVGVLAPPVIPVNG
jgi:hypothetical protein